MRQIWAGRDETANCAVLACRRGRPHGCGLPVIGRHRSRPRHRPRQVMARPGAGGFTLIELLVVVAIAVVVIALALPNLYSMASTLTLRQGLNQLSALAQQCRMQAVQRNKYKFLHLTTNSGRLVAYIDDGASPAGLTPMSNQLYLPRNVSFVAAPTSSSPTPLDAANCGGTSVTLCSTNSSTCDIYFGPLGIPNQCTSGISSCTPNVAFAYYFNYTGSLGGTNWAALCVSPAGRLKSWYWTGSSWGN